MVVHQLKEIEDAIYEAGLNRRRFKEKLENILSEYKGTYSLLRELKSEIDSYEETRKAVKVTSSTVSVLGGVAATGAFVAGFFTGGATWIPLVTSAGLTSALVGSAVRITTDIVDIIKSKGYGARLEAIITNLKSHAKVVEECSRSPNIASDLIKDCFSMNSTQAESCLKAILQRLSSRKSSSSTSMESVTGGLIVTLSMVAPFYPDGTTKRPVRFLSLQSMWKQTKKQNTPWIETNLWLEVFDAVVKVPGMTLFANAAPNIGKTNFIGGYINNKLTVEQAAVAIGAGFTLLAQPAVEGVAKLGATAGTQVSGKVASFTAAEVFGAVSVGLCVVFTAFEIASLVEELNAAANPTIELINKLCEQLDKAQEQITELLNEEEYKIEFTELSAIFDHLENELEESDEDEEDEKKLKVYDISPQTIGIFFKQRNIDLFGNQRPFSANPMSTIHELLKEVGKKSSLKLSHYFYIEGALEKLVSLRSATIDFMPREDSLTSDHSQIIVFDDNTDSVVLDTDTKESMRHSFFPIHWLLRLKFKLRREECRGLCVIYRIRCVLCEQLGREFNYVGQTSDLASRLSSHERSIREGFEDGHQDFQFRKPIYAHYSMYHARHFGNNCQLADVFEVDICHRLQEYKGDAHSNVRRSWEVYYQWLFKARTSEGGLSIR